MLLYVLNLAVILVLKIMFFKYFEIYELNHRNYKLYFLINAEIIYVKVKREKAKLYVSIKFQLNFSFLNKLQ